jgi:hypothetical protein
MLIFYYGNAGSGFKKIRKVNKVDKQLYAWRACNIIK